MGVAYDLCKNEIKVVSLSKKNIGLMSKGLTNISKRSFSTTITLSNRYEELKKKQEKYLGYKREAYDEYINTVRRHEQVYEEYSRAVSLLKESNNEISDRIAVPPHYCTQRELARIQELKEKYINWCNQLNPTKYEPVQLEKMKRDAYTRQLEELESIIAPAIIRSEINDDVKLSLNIIRDRNNVERQSIVDHVKGHYLRYKEMTRIMKERDHAWQRADFEYDIRKDLANTARNDSTWQGEGSSIWSSESESSRSRAKSLPWSDSAPETNSSVSYKKSELKSKYPWPSDGAGRNGPPGSGGTGIGGPSGASGPSSSGGFGGFGQLFKSLDNFIFNISFDLLHILQEHSLCLRFIFPIFVIYKLYSWHIHYYIIIKLLKIYDICIELRGKKLTNVCSWLTLQFYTNALQRILNIYSNYLDLCLNSPPKPHVFVNLPLQSSFRILIKRTGSSITGFIALDGYRRTIINDKNSNLQTEAKKNYLTQKRSMIELEH